MSDLELLEKVNSPEDVEALDESQLPILCEQIREFLIETTSKTGGHLASNLGVVELTVAIHRNFNSPKDKIVFDVGHQSYTHKILTGRKDKFGTLRKEGGLSGFPRPNESVHDSFIAGHSSTSVSVGLGLSEAKKIKGEDGYVVVVIGDGALTGGMVYEALNNADKTNDNLIVILNDNEMSISKNVGAMSKYLNKIRVRPNYHKLKFNVERSLLQIPIVGRKIRNRVFRFKTSLKSLFYDSTIFEDMGFAYLGPIDGHNLNQLDDVFTIAKKMQSPVLIHANTIKGKGYSYAEEHPDAFHGISCFDRETGEAKSCCKSFSNVFGEKLLELAEKNDKICAITAAMGGSTGILPIKNKFPKRYFDVGIAEEHAVTFACGLSISGLIPAFAVYSSFLQRAYDQLIHDAAVQNLHLVLGIDRAGIVGDDGETHQGVFDVAFLNTIPNTTVYAPSSFSELKYSLEKAVNATSGIQAIRYPRGGEFELPNDFAPSDKPYQSFGNSNAKTAIITYGRLFSNALKAQSELGDSVKIIKLNRIKPIDENAVAEAMELDNLFFFEEGIKSGGVAQVLGSLLAERGYKGKYKIIAIEDKFVPQATVERAFESLGLDAKSMVDIIKRNK